MARSGGAAAAMAAYSMLPDSAETSMGHQADPHEEHKEHPWRSILDSSDPEYLLNIHSTAFSMVVGGVIILNAAIIGLETDLGAADFVFFEHFCTLFFLAEMLMRIKQLTLKGYLGVKSNLFDCFLVNTGLLDLYVLPFLDTGKNSSSHSVIGSLRLLRMFRILRIVRLFSVFRELQIILDAFFKAFHSVMWVGTLIIILDYVCGVFLTQIVGHQAALWGDQEETITNWFGCLGYSMRTLCFMMTLSDWDTIVLTVSEQHNGVVVFSLAACYVLITAYTMISLITGVICEALITAQRQDEQHRMAAIEEGQRAFAAGIKNLLISFDWDGSGTINHQEVKQALETSGTKLQTKLQALDIHMDIQELCTLVDRLAAEDPAAEGEVSIEEIADALSHLTGSATSHAVWETKHVLLQKERESKEERAHILGEIKELTEHVAKVGAHIANVDARLDAHVASVDAKLDHICRCLAAGPRF